MALRQRISLEDTIFAEFIGIFGLFSCLMVLVQIYKVALCHIYPQGGAPRNNRYWRFPSMARVTVEDCITKIPNRFDLLMIAAQRARNISSGSELTLERDNDKNPVVALREIADETINFSELEDGIITGLQRYVEVEEPEEDEMDLMQAIHHDVEEDEVEMQADIEEKEEVVVDALTVHDVAAEEVDAAFEDAETLQEGGELEES